jgi:hypothetical protein
MLLKNDSTYFSHFKFIAAKNGYIATIIFIVILSNLYVLSPTIILFLLYY